MRPRLAVRCPAKINLALRVLDRRPDGYHELDTVFQAIDLWDEIEVEPGDGLRLECDDPRLSDDSNLVLEAARLLAAECGPSQGGATLRLTKRIPLQAGLGGGSSDAAGALLLCARHWGLDLDTDRLHDLARRLGADVPFFLVGGTARGRGRGDRIEPLPFAGPLPLLLGQPPFGLATGEVFRRASERLTLPGIGVSLPAVSAHKWLQDNDFGFLANDLEGVVYEDWPELERFRDALRAVGARAALLSGSGATVYGIFDSDESIERAVAALAGRFRDWRLRVTRAIDGGVRVAGRADPAG